MSGRETDVAAGFEKLHSYRQSSVYRSLVTLMLENRVSQTQIARRNASHRTEFRGRVSTERHIGRIELIAMFALLLMLARNSVLAEEKAFVAGGTVVDAVGHPLDSVRVTLHRWDGQMSPALQTKSTESDGAFEFLPQSDDAYYVILRKESFATTGQYLEPSSKPKIVLRPAVDTWIEVRDATGAPLKDARIVNLSIRSNGNSADYVWRGVEHLYEWTFQASDAAGRINLPPLPEGTTVDICVDHPLWAQAKLENVQVAKGMLSSLNLNKGIMTTFEFVTDSRVPMTLEGLSCEVLAMARGSGATATINRVSMKIVNNQVHFCAHPTKYDLIRLKIPGTTITPGDSTMTLALGEEKKVRFLVRQNLKSTGRVIHSDGSPHQGARVLAMAENIAPDDLTPGEGKNAYCGHTETDAAGRYSIDLPVGKCQIEIDAEGYFSSDRDFFEVDVQAGGLNTIPEIVTQKVQPIVGQVVDETGKPVRDALVRVRHPSDFGSLQRTDAEGQFKITLRSIPLNLISEQRQYEVDVCAFITDRVLMGTTRVDLRQPESLNHAKIELRPDPSAAALLSMEDNHWFENRIKQFVADNKRDPYPAGEQGQIVPEFDGATWLNTDARSLKEFRGRYVLLDFWFIGCGPCEADLPSLKLVHERFAKEGVTVIGVHNNSSPPERVQEYCQNHGIDYPTVVDHKDGRILQAYQSLGVNGFPTYILIDPDGKVLINDRTTMGSSLRRFKVEIIRQIVNERRQN